MYNEDQTLGILWLQFGNDWLKNNYKICNYSTSDFGLFLTARVHGEYCRNQVHKGIFKLIGKL